MSEGRTVTLNSERRLRIRPTLLPATEPRFGFRLIVEEGLSHAVPTQIQGCEPVIVNVNETFSLENSRRETEICSVRVEPTFEPQVFYLQRPSLCYRPQIKEPST